MKRAINVLAAPVTALTLAFSLTGCGGESKPTPDEIRADHESRLKPAAIAIATLAMNRLALRDKRVVASDDPNNMALTEVVFSSIAKDHQEIATMYMGQSADGPTPGTVTAITLDSYTGCKNVKKKGLESCRYVERNVIAAPGSPYNLNPDTRGWFGETTITNKSKDGDEYIYTNTYDHPVSPATNNDSEALQTADYIANQAQRSFNDMLDQ